MKKSLKFCLIGSSDIEGVVYKLMETQSLEFFCAVYPF